MIFIKATGWVIDYKALLLSHNSGHNDQELYSLGKINCNDRILVCTQHRNHEQHDYELSSYVSYTTKISSIISCIMIR